MALFRHRKNDRVLDLTEKYKKQLDVATQQEPAIETVPQQTESSSNGFNFLGSMASGVQSAEPAGNVDEPISVNVEERKRRLAKRFTDMTNQIESLSNQIYHLQQRIEVLERKSGIRME